MARALRRGKRKGEDGWMKKRRGGGEEVKRRMDEDQEKRW